MINIVRSIVEALTSNDVIDTSTTGMSYYDNLLPTSDDHDRQAILKGKLGTIEYMEPDEYNDEVVKMQHSGKSIFQTSKSARDTAKEYSELMKNGEKFPLLVLDYVADQQEGRHRAEACRLLGIDTIPVLVVRAYDIKDDLKYPDSIQIWNKSIRYHTTNNKFEQVDVSPFTIDNLVDTVKEVMSYEDYDEDYVFDAPVVN